MIRYVSYILLTESKKTSLNFLPDIGQQCAAGCPAVMHQHAGELWQKSANGCAPRLGMVRRPSQSLGNQRMQPVQRLVHTQARLVGWFRNAWGPAVRWPERWL